MLIIHHIGDNGKVKSTTKLTKQEIAVRLAGGLIINQIKQCHGQTTIWTQHGKKYLIETINDRNAAKLLQLSTCSQRYIFLEDDKEKARLTNYNGLDVYCSVREVP